MHDESLPTGMDDVIRELRRPVRLDSDFDQSVMRAVRAVPLHRRLGLWARMLRPRTVTVKPLPWAVAFAGLVCAAALGTVQLSRSMQRSAEFSGPPSSEVAAVENGILPVEFVLVAPAARKVAVVGDFNDWDSRHADFQAEHQGGGVWSVTASIPVGHHRYSFIVDDSLWIADPTAPRVAGDDFGLPASALVVGELGQ